MSPRFLKALPLLALSACFGPTFPKEGVEKALEELCRKEKVTVDAQLIGETLHARVEADLVGEDLVLDEKKGEVLDKVLSKINRIVLSTDAPLSFAVVEVVDKTTGASLILVENIQDFRGVVTIRIPRSAFQERLIVEWVAAEDRQEPHAIDLPEFLARLAASRLQRQLTQNPLVSVFLQVRGVRGRVEKGTLIFLLERSGESPVDSLAGSILEEAVAEATLAAVSLYDKDGSLVQGVRVEESQGKEILRKSVVELQQIIVQKSS